VSEADLDYKQLAKRYRNTSKNITHVISHAGVDTAFDLDAACIVPITDSGFAARMVSRSRPKSPILAVTASEVVCRQLNLSWGCIPMLSEKPFQGDSEVFDIAEEMALKSGIAKPGSVIVALAGVPVGRAGATNTMRVRTVGDVLASGKGNKLGTKKGVARLFTQTENDGRTFFEKGDIIICTHTDDSMIEHLKKAGALVVGSWEKVDLSHAETIAQSLDLPLLRVKVKATDFVKEGTPITVDTNKGMLINGYRD